MAGIVPEDTAKGSAGCSLLNPQCHITRPSIADGDYHDERHPLKNFERRGLSEPATTSLAHALELFGLQEQGLSWDHVVARVPAILSSVDLRAVDSHDALTDTPIPSFYRELDKKYPNSKLILTVRGRGELAQVMQEAVYPAPSAEHAK